ncbi:MAG: hypothetical protein H7Y31_13325 [Chitinophagaceae bacterium]|nr:hypothetical protein [Chitinophagaceae bacterium]
MKFQLFVVLALMSSSLIQAQVGIGTTTPNSTLDVRGSLSAGYRTFSTATSATAADNTIVFTGTSASTITLPDATACIGRVYWIKNTSTNASLLTINTVSSQTIEGLATWAVTQVNKSLQVISNGTNWVITSESLPGNSAGTSWIQGGNNTTALQNIGTTSNYDLPFITNNSEKMRLTSTGRLAIGTASFNGTYPEKFLVDAGTTTSVNAIVAKGTINNYLQLNIQNLSNGSSASSDVVATADNGSETTNYVDMGINGSVNSSGIMGAANDAYLYNVGQNLLIGTGSASKSLVFMTGGTVQSSNERLRIDGNGNVGIGTSVPAYKLQVIAGSNPLWLGGLQTGSAADSFLTVSNGVVRRVGTSGINAWGLTGNASTNPTTNFIGTTDAQAFIIKTNSAQCARFDLTSIALGTGATTANSPQSYAFGTRATIGFNKLNAVAIGTDATVNHDSAFSIGVNAITNGLNSFSIGTGANSNSTNSFAVGRNAVTGYSITDGVAIGGYASATGNNSLAIGSTSVSGNKTTATASNSVAIGVTAAANSTSAIAIGTNATVGYGLSSPGVAIGFNTIVNGNNGVALGAGATTSFAANSTAIGGAATATGANSTAIGYNAAVTQNNALILGDRSNTSLAVGIGSESFSGSNREKLLVDAGTTGSVNAIVGRGTINNYLQLNIQNQSNGANASSDVVATADNGSETNNYVDMGINGSLNASGIMGNANDAYLYNMGQNFLVGTGSISKSLVFMTGGTSQTTNERMRIDGNGNVGVGTNNPGNKLEVNSGTGGVSGLRLKQLPAGSVLFTNSTADVTQNNGNLYFDATNYRLGIAAGTTPTSTLQVGGSVSLPITVKTGAYTAAASDYTIVVNNSGTVTIALPAAATSAGRVYIIKKISGAANDVIIDPNGSETIDAVTTRTITVQFDTWMIQSDGTSWYIISKS